MSDAVDYFRKKFGCHCSCEDIPMCTRYNQTHVEQVGLEKFDKFIDEIISIQPASALAAFREAEIRVFGRAIT